MSSLRLGLVLSLLAAPAFAAPADPLALYRFDQGDATDSSGNGNDGTIVGGVSFAASQPGFGTAASFSPAPGLSGIRTPVDINSAVLPALTMGAWIRPDTFGTGSFGPGKMLSHDNGGFDRTIGFDGRGDSPGTNIAAFTGSGVADIDGTFSAFGTWTHYAVRYDGANSALFRNGAPVESFTAGSSVSGLSLFIGTNPGFDEDFDGLMDDVFVYGRALTDAEIADIFANGFATPVPLPAGLPLLAAALAGLALARRRG
ncbi:MAG: LamG domain-containing protein [Paracoccaceae bacterium]|jgi:hypothetical protein|nr:LamG domain-containing protein [Paracoccaceae bacterium]